MIGDLIGEWIKGILIDGIMGNLSGLFNTVNTKVGEIASDVGSTPQDWNGGIFSMLQNLSETVIVPIAAAILALVMCYELIDMIASKMASSPSWLRTPVCCIRSNTLRHSAIKSCSRAVLPATNSPPKWVSTWGAPSGQSSS